MPVQQESRRRHEKKGQSQSTPRTELDFRGCLVLSDIVESFHTPISEEHAWALCYQSAKCGQAILTSPDDREECLMVTTLDQFLIHKDGTVHPDTFLDSTDFGKGLPRIKCSNEAKIISNLVLVIFLALDYGFSGEDERSISADLESLLESMASADGNNVERSETDDEGIEIERDSDDERGPVSHFDFNSIIQVCARRVSHSSPIQTADSHYKAVCRAYVTEALELSTFLENVTNGTLDSENLRNLCFTSDPELEKLEFTDWARLWVQVIRELRQGVKLKKVEFCRGPPIEYELTPYEILMDDIRSRRYKLNKVMVNGSIPLPKRIKKDAHAIILEFIRSRPPLRKAADRILGPAPLKNPTPIEKLMESIRQEHKLAPVTTPPKDSNPRIRRSRMKSTTALLESCKAEPVNKASTITCSGKIQSLNNPSSTLKESQIKSQPQKRLINFDLNFLHDPDLKDEDDFDFSDPEDSPTPEPISGFFGHICPERSQSTPVTPSRILKTSEFNIKCSPGQIDKRRRHSIGNPTIRGEHGSTLITFPFEYTTAENVFNTLKCPRASPLLARRTANLPRSVSKSSLQEEFFQSNHWQTAVECLSLNLEEVVHIRHVLTKAELETLPIDCSVKEDVEKGKICFLCLRTRFSLIFGPWGNVCRLCKRTICNKCCSKMRIPAEQFANVPVSTLSPNISPQDEDFPGSAKSLTPTSSSQTLPVTNINLIQKSSGAESAPNSPNLSRKSIGTESDSGKRSLSPGLIDDDERRDHFGTESSHAGSSGHRSLPTVQSISIRLMAIKRRSFGRKKTDDKTDRHGSLMVVCHDCKAMVLQIIRSSRAKKAAALFRNTNVTLEIPILH